MVNLSDLGVKLPWYPEVYIEQLPERFPEVFSGKTRQELFKILYESVDRESPDYEDLMGVVLEAHELVTGNIIDDDILFEPIYETQTVTLKAKNPNLLYYLFETLPEQNIIKLGAAIDSTIENIGSSYLILGSLGDTENTSLITFSRSIDIQEVSFATLEGFEKHGALVSNASPLLALSISVDDKDAPGEAILDTHIIRRSLTQSGDVYILKKNLSFDEFVELFNQTDWGI